MSSKLILLMLLFFIQIPFASSQTNDTQQASSESYLKQAEESFKQAELYNSQNPDSAAIYRHHIRQSLCFYEKAGVTSNHAQYNILLGISLFMENKLDSATIYFKQALMPYQENPDYPENKIKKLGYLFLTHAYKALGQHELAVQYGNMLIAHATAIKDSATIADYSYTVGTVYRDMGQMDNALASFKEGARIGEAIGNYDIASSCQNSSANIYNKAGEAKKALPLSKAAMKNAVLSGKKFNISMVFSSQADIYTALERYDEAIAAYRGAMEVDREMGNEELYKLSETKVAQLMSITGKQKEAAAKVIEHAADEDFEIHVDSLIIPGSYQDLKMQVITSNTNAEDKKMKFDILHQEYLEKQAESLRQRIWFISLSAGLIIVLLLLLYNRQRQKAKAESAARYAQEKENEYISLQQETELRMIRKYIDGLESERSRISKELHDGICNDLLAVEIQLKNSGKDIDEQAAMLQNARENIRNVSHELMPPAFQYASIDEILHDYVTHIRTPENVHIQYSQSDSADWSNVPQKTAFEIYRITQEAVGNSVKHAGANKIAVLLSMKGHEIILEIIDNGIGFDKTKHTRNIGLRTIRERVESIGGTLAIETNNSGTTIKVGFGI